MRRTRGSNTQPAVDISGNISGETAGGPSDYIVRYARLRKALKIADYLQAGGIASCMAQVASAYDRELAAKAAGTPIPSVECWKIVVELLVSREKAMLAVHGGKVVRQ